MEVKCDNCGGLFDRPQAWLGRSKTTCCSRECSYELKIKRSTKTCLQCGEDFYSNSHQKQKKYCSRACSAASKEKMKVSLNCNLCGSVFFVNQARKDSAKYCSSQCYIGYKRKIKESILTI